jgi:hypothetical protein
MNGSKQKEVKSHFLKKAKNVLILPTNFEEKCTETFAKFDKIQEKVLRYFCLVQYPAVWTE